MFANLFAVAVSVVEHDRVGRVHLRAIEAGCHENTEINYEDSHQSYPYSLRLVITLNCCKENDGERDYQDVTDYLRYLYPTSKGVDRVVLI